MFVLQSNVFLLLCPIGGNDRMFPLSIKMKWKESVFPSRRFRICFIVLPYERIRSIKYPVKRKSYNRRNESELKKFFTGHITEIYFQVPLEMYREQYGSWTMLWCTKVPA